MAMVALMTRWEVNSVHLSFVFYRKKSEACLSREIKLLGIVTQFSLSKKPRCVFVCVRSLTQNAQQLTKWKSSGLQHLIKWCETNIILNCSWGFCLLFFNLQGAALTVQAVCFCSRSPLQADTLRSHSQRGQLNLPLRTDCFASFTKSMWFPVVCAVNPELKVNKILKTKHQEPIPYRFCTRGHC